MTTGSQTDGEAACFLEGYDRERARADALAAQLAEAEAACAVMRFRLFEVRSYIMDRGMDERIADVLATDAGRKLLDVVRGLPEWVRTRIADRARQFPLDDVPGLETALLALARVSGDALREHLRAAGIETGGEK